MKTAARSSWSWSPGVMLPVLVSLLLPGFCLPTQAKARTWEYIVVGAGPSGLQMGHLLQEAGRDYVLLERAGVPGSFYTKYPRHGKLISINKRFTGKTNKEFNMRHDWNSLLSNDESLLLKHYSTEFFPPNTALLNYLSDYQKKLNISVQYNTDVSGIERLYNESLGDHYFQMHDQHGNVYKCRTLVIATGIWVPNIPEFPGMNTTDKYESISTDPKDYEGQNVLIVGRGNAAFETADSIQGSTNLVHMMGRSRVRLSWETHYVGDLRAINNGLLDTYQLKSLDGVFEASTDQMAVSQRDGLLYLYEQSQMISTNETDGYADSYDNFAAREGYHRIILCLGFNFDDSIFTNSTSVERASNRGRTKKYPKIRDNYESASVPGMFFAGTNTHSLDFRKSAGGFIHGFRYTTRALFHLLEWRNHRVPWPSHSGAIHSLLTAILKRVNEASEIYQMFSVLGDVIAISRDRSSYTYLEAFPINLLDRVESMSGHDVQSVIVVVMQYGQNFSGPGKDIFRETRATGEPSEGHQSNFLHPVFYYYKSLPAGVDSKLPGQVLPKPDRMHHLVEDFLTTWDAPLSHVLPLRRFLETCLDTDLRNFFAEDCLKMALVFNKLPTTCEAFYLQGLGVTGTEQLVDQAYRAGLTI